MNDPTGPAVLVASETLANSPVTGAVATVPIVLSLLAAGWALLATVRDRPPDWSHLVSLAVVEVSLLVLAVSAVQAMSDGARPGEPGTFAGYLVTLVCLPPLAAVLAKMEPTRWGSVIITVICLVNPVVVVRLQQTWAVAGG